MRVLSLSNTLCGLDNNIRMMGVGWIGMTNVQDSDPDNQWGINRFESTGNND